MRLTKHLKAKIVEQFKSGASVAECARWYNQQGIRVEGVIREALVAQEKLDRPASSGMELVSGVMLGAVERL